MSLEDVLIETNKQLAVLTAAILQQNELIRLPAQGMLAGSAPALSVEIPARWLSAQEMSGESAPITVVPVEKETKTTPTKTASKKSAAIAETKKDEVKITKAQVTESLIKVINAYGDSGRAKASSVLNEFNAQNVTQLDEADYAAVIALATKVAAEAPAAASAE